MLYFFWGEKQWKITIYIESKGKILIFHHTIKVLCQKQTILTTSFCQYMAQTFCIKTHHHDMQRLLLRYARVQKGLI
jgi:hypothetical protein